MTWTEGDVDVDGVRLHTYRRGRGAPIVLAHGATDNGRCWDRVASALEEQFELLAYDARGHGRSEASDDWGDGGGDLIAVVETLGLDHPVAMGHSMGAAASAAALAARPDLFRAGVLEDPPWMAQRPKVDVAARAALAEQFAAMLQGTTQEIAARGRQQNPDWDDAEFDAWAESKTQFRPTARWADRFTRDRPRWQDSVVKFECPVLLVRGGNAERGRIVTDEIATEARSLCPTLEVAVLPDAGHNVRREAFTDYVAAVRTFLLAHT
jgi:pimeloyl-ACP methyl ester carboxylesterase